MASSPEMIKIATDIVDPLVAQAPKPQRDDFSVWATACLLVEPAMQGSLDPESDDFPEKAKEVIRNVTGWNLHHDRADMVLNSGDPIALGILANACRQARDYSQRGING